MSSPAAVGLDPISAGTTPAPPSYELSIDLGQIIKDTGDGVALLRRDVHHLKANAEQIPQLQSSMSNLEQNLEDMRVMIERNLKALCDRQKVPYTSYEQVRTSRVQEEAARSQGSRWQRRVVNKTLSSRPMMAMNEERRDSSE